MRIAATAGMPLVAAALIVSPAPAQKGPPAGEPAEPPVADRDAPCAARIAAIQAVMDNPVGVDPTLLTLAQSWLARGIFACENQTGAGQSEIAAATLDVVEEMLGMDAPEPESQGPREAGLTADYLVGEWCYRHQSGESGYYVFHPDGTYELGPASMRYELVADGTVDDWMREIEGVWELQPDRFVLDMGNWRHTYTRGTCG